MVEILIGGFAGLLIGVAIIWIRLEVQDWKESDRNDKFITNYIAALKEWEQVVIKSGEMINQNDWLWENHPDLVIELTKLESELR